MHYIYQRYCTLCTYNTEKCDMNQCWQTQNINFTAEQRPQATHCSLMAYILDAIHFWDIVACIKATATGIWVCAVAADTSRLELLCLLLRRHYLQTERRYLRSLEAELADWADDEMIAMKHLRLLALYKMNLVIKSWVSDLTFLQALKIDCSV